MTRQQHSFNNQRANLEEQQWWIELWFILRGDLFYDLPCVILFLCFSDLLVLQLPRLGKRELILMLFVRLFDLRLFGFVYFLFLFVSGKGCSLWLCHSYLLMQIRNKRAKMAFNCSLESFDASSAHTYLKKYDLVT